MRTLKKQLQQHERWCFFPLPSIWFVSWLGWCDPKSDHHHLALARPTMKFLPAQSAAANKKCRPIFGDPTQRRRPIFVEIKWQTMGFSHLVLWWKHERESTSTRHWSPIKKGKQKKVDVEFGLGFLPLDSYFGLLCVYVCILLFLKRKAKCILFNIYSDFLCWLAAAGCCPFRGIWIIVIKRQHNNNENNYAYIPPVHSLPGWWLPQLVNGNKSGFNYFVHSSNKWKFHEKNYWWIK
jgi:hypothetical protein